MSYLHCPSAGLYILLISPAGILSQYVDIIYIFHFWLCFGIFAGSGTYLRFRDHRVWSLPASISCEFVLRVQITWIRKASLSIKFQNQLFYLSISACTLMITYWDCLMFTCYLWACFVTICYVHQFIFVL